MQFSVQNQFMLPVVHSVPYIGRDLNHHRFRNCPNFSKVFHIWDTLTTIDVIFKFYHICKSHALMG